MDCSFNGVPTQAVWDTGSQVIMISEEWRRRHLPHTTVRSIDELVDTGTVLGKAVNKTAIPFVGWVEVKFLLKSGDALKSGLFVPMLIARNPRVPEEPIIGLNVINEMIKCGMETYPAVITRALSEALSIDCK